MSLRREKIEVEIVVFRLGSFSMSITVRMPERHTRTRSHACRIRKYRLWIQKHADSCPRRG